MEHFSSPAKVLNIDCPVPATFLYKTNCRKLAIFVLESDTRGITQNASIHDSSCQLSNPLYQIVSGDISEKPGPGTVDCLAV